MQNELKKELSPLEWLSEELSKKYHIKIDTYPEFKEAKKKHKALLTSHVEHAFKRGFSTGIRFGYKK